jgi:hypothetical protein
MKIYPNVCLLVANSILESIDESQIDPDLAYAGLGCAFQKIHQRLGKDKKEWIETTKKMSEISNWEKNDP